LETEQNNQLLIRSRSVVSRVVAGETLVVPVRGKVGDLASIYSFNGTGSLIWRLLEEPKGLVELSGALAREYKVTFDQAQEDVQKFVDDLRTVGLVEVFKGAALAGVKATLRSGWETGDSR
jgi:hypothetical protein